MWPSWPWSNDIIKLEWGPGVLIQCASLPYRAWFWWKSLILVSVILSDRYISSLHWATNIYSICYAINSIRRFPCFAHFLKFIRVPKKKMGLLVLCKVFYPFYSIKTRKKITLFIVCAYLILFSEFKRSCQFRLFLCFILHTLFRDPHFLLSRWKVDCWLTDWPYLSFISLSTSTHPGYLSH